MTTIDFKKDPIYKAKTTPEILTIPNMLFVTFTGRGAPGDGQVDGPFQHAIQALYGIVYTMKFWDKKHTPPTGYAKFTVPPLEGLWWTASGAAFNSKDPDDWRWKIMLRVPEFVTPTFFGQVVSEAVEEKQSDSFKQARPEHFEEGRVVQIMHIGPYDAEQPSIDTMLGYAKARGYTPTGHHHELYFGDPRRSAPEKLRTILRHPVSDTGHTK